MSGQEIPITHEDVKRLSPEAYAVLIEHQEEDPRATRLPDVKFWLEDVSDDHDQPCPELTGYTGHAIFLQDPEDLIIFYWDGEMWTC